MSGKRPRTALITSLVCVAAVVAAVAEEPPVAAGPAPAAGPEAWPVDGLDDAWAIVHPEIAEGEPRPLKRRADGGTARLLAGSGERAGQSWTRTLGALAGVVGLIVFLAWGYRAIAAGKLPLAGKARRPGLIEIVGRTPLSARQSLCLVRIGPRLVLVGQSHDNLRALDVIEDADLVARLAGEAARKRAGSSHAEFHECLEREAREYGQPLDDLDETVTPDAQRIDSVQQGLTRTIRRIQQAAAQR